jgi:hypothetical protein
MGSRCRLLAQATGVEDKYRLIEILPDSSKNGFRNIGKASYRKADFSGVREIIGSGQAHRFTFKAVIGTDYEEDKPASENEVGGSVDMHDVGTAMSAITDRGINPKAIAFPSGFPTDDA